LVSRFGELPIPAEADFCITGTIDPAKTLPEGPFGDHLGYYSLAHDFPVLRVENVFHRPDAIWPFTTVGRPPQEDTSFGAFIHELTGPLIPTVLPGVHAVHAVDAAGVHPLLLAIGSERYTPYAARQQPQELLTQANALLGQGQMSLAKYLLIVAQQDDPALVQIPARRAPAAVGLDAQRSVDQLLDTQRFRRLQVLSGGEYRAVRRKLSPCRWPFAHDSSSHAITSIS
jgi:4-hydroxy-3-polyprenylbenzoate decarboxylase